MAEADFMQSGNSAFAVVDLHGEYILRLRRLNTTKPHTNYQHLTPFFQLPAVERVNSLAKQASAVELTVPFFSSTFCV